MVKRAVGAATAYSLRVVEAVKILREQAGLSNAELMKRAAFSSNYFYIRLRGESPFDMNDLDRIARALQVDVHDITQLASSLPDPTASDDSIELDGEELARRLMLLAGPSTTGVEIEGVSTGLWATLISGQSVVDAPKIALTTVSEHFKVPVLYLTDFQAVDVKDRVEAEMELSRALQDAGATPIAARALGTLSPSALLAVAESIRSIDLGNGAK